MLRRMSHNGCYARKNRLEEVGSAAIASHLFLGLSACCSGEHPTAASIWLAASACSVQDSCVFSRAHRVYTVALAQEASRAAAQRYLGLSACCSGEHPFSTLPLSAGHHCSANDGLNIDELPEYSAAAPVLSGFSRFKGPVPVLFTARGAILTSGRIARKA